MTSSTTNNYKLIGFFPALTLIFVIAKIFGYLTWSWLWVLSPMIFEIALSILLIAIILIIALVGVVLK